MKRIGIILAIVAPLLGFSQTSETVTLTIEQAIQMALDSNYSIKIAKNTADQINATWGSSGALPVVSLNGNYSNGKHIVDDGGIARGSIDLDWTVFDGMRMFATHSKNQSLDEINSIYFRAMVENTIRQVINQYYLIVSTQQQMVSIQQTLAVSQTRYEHVLARHEIGSASKLDALNAKVDFNTDSSSYLRAEEQILSAKASLNQLLARPINTEFEVVEDIPFTPYMDFANLHAKALEQNTDLNIARLETMMGEATLKETDALLMPTVSLNAGYDFMRLNQNSMGFYYGAGFRMNLFNGLETARKRKNARLELESIKLAEEASILDLETRLRLNFINYQTNRDLVILESENIDVAKQNMDISLERYKLGNLSALELRESQRNYLNAIDRYTNSLYLTKLAETILKQLAGELGK